MSDCLQIAGIIIGVLLVIIIAILFYRLMCWMLTPKLHVKKGISTTIDRQHVKLDSEKTKSQATASNKVCAFRCLQFVLEAHQCFLDIVLDVIQQVVENKMLVEDSLLSLMDEICSSHGMLKDLSTNAGIMLEQHFTVIYQSCATLVKNGALIQQIIQEVSNEMPSATELIPHQLTVNVLMRRCEMLLKNMAKEMAGRVIMNMAQPVSTLESSTANGYNVDASLNK